jgi:hypothetical protein
VYALAFTAEEVYYLDSRTDSVARHDVEREMITLHADRGAGMRSKPAAALLVDLDVGKTTAGNTSRTTTRTWECTSKP